MPFDAPFQLGPFTVATDGRLALADAGCPPRFHLTWRERVVHAQLTLPPDTDPAVARLRLQAVVGRVPSTLGEAGRNEPEGLRVGIFAHLRSLGPTLPEGWTLDLLADHRVALAAGLTMTLPTSVTALLTDITLFLLRLGPYLDMLAEVGVEGSREGGDAGMLKTCPG